MKIKNSKTGKVEDIRLPKAFKAKWIKSLRSGDYLQTSGTLYNSNDNDGKGGFCCLGVCVRMMHPKLDTAKAGTICSGDGFDGFKKLNDIKVPDCLKGEYNDGNVLVDKLVDMNDGTGCNDKKSFKQIASWIEKNL